jgi:hypothetical protein
MIFERRENTMQVTKPRRSGLKWLIGVALLPLLIFAFYRAFVLNWSYSDGERAGYLQKFSRKGWLFSDMGFELANGEALLVRRAIATAGKP